jgi:hypothetical protein
LLIQNSGYFLPKPMAAPGHSRSLAKPSDERCSVEAFAFCEIAYRDGDVVDHWIPRKDDQAGAPDLMSL